MDMETDKEGYLELFVKWYEDPEVLQMVKKRLVSPSTAKTTDIILGCKSHVDYAYRQQEQQRHRQREQGCR
ncbi:hypothetical protein Pyn_22535 [Prunus yedoensis var. nudiflora]|uniref:Uncharacterized protein n=1 Tax=Prunus yedoensis var. nudiflora TaxID=2094558 RepID=A0A314ZP20_PRUYE|nr:hypothetical protein Pyn_22535 [Prunus yedoensis var. nudiflora]